MRLGWSRAFANAVSSSGGLRNRRRIHAAWLVKFFGLVRGLRCCCSVAASCGSTLATPTPLRPAGNPAGSPAEVPAWDGLGHSGPPARGTCKSACILQARVTRERERSGGIHAAGASSADGSAAGACCCWGVVQTRLGLSGGCANTRWAFEGLGNRRRIHAAWLAKFLELVARLEVLLRRRRLLRLDPRWSDAAQTRRLPAGSPVEVPAWDGLGHSGPPARGTCKSACILQARVTRERERSGGIHAAGASSADGFAAGANGGVVRQSSVNGASCSTCCSHWR